ncbi:MAG: YciI family protein [Gammaproteobacteria bacterium]
MNYFLYKLNSPRPSFPADITPDERKLMQEHVVYWGGLMSQGLVIAFGPVADPKGSYGISILRLKEGADANTLGAGDPAIVANAGFNFEVYPMPRLVLATEHA